MTIIFFEKLVNGKKVQLELGCSEKKIGIDIDTTTKKKIK